VFISFELMKDHNSSLRVSQMAPDTSAQFALDAALLFPPSIPASHLDPPDIDWNQLQNDMQSLYSLPNPTSAAPDGGFPPLSLDGGFPPLALDGAFPLNGGGFPPLTLDGPFPPLALDAWPRLHLTASPIASETEGGELDPALTTSNGRAKRKAADGSTDAPNAKKARRNVENTEPRTDGMAPGALAAPSGGILPVKKTRKPRSDKGKKRGDATNAITTVTTATKKPRKPRSNKGKKRAVA
jgi:hypothetical protein